MSMSAVGLQALRSGAIPCSVGRRAVIGNMAVPNSPQDMWDALFFKVQGSKVDPSVLFGFPQDPSKISSDLNAQSRYVGTLDGVTYGAARAAVSVGGVALILGGVLGYFICKHVKKG